MADINSYAHDIFMMHYTLVEAATLATNYAYSSGSFSIKSLLANPEPLNLPGSNIVTGFRHRCLNHTVLGYRWSTTPVKGFKNG